MFTEENGAMMCASFKAPQYPSNHLDSERDSQKSHDRDKTSTSKAGNSRCSNFTYLTIPTALTYYHTERRYRARRQVQRFRPSHPGLYSQWFFLAFLEPLQLTTFSCPGFAGFVSSAVTLSSMGNFRTRYQYLRPTLTDLTKTSIKQNNQEIRNMALVQLTVGTPLKRP